MCKEIVEDFGVIWYEDDKYIIAFSEMPDIEVRYINLYYMSKEEINEIKKKPYILNNDVNVLLVDSHYSPGRFRRDAFP